MAIPSFQLALASHPEIIRFGWLSHVERHRPAEERTGLASAYLAFALPHLLGTTSGDRGRDMGLPGDLATRQFGLHIPRREFYEVPERKDGEEAFLREPVVAPGPAGFDDDPQEERSLERLAMVAGATWVRG